MPNEHPAYVRAHAPCFGQLDIKNDSPVLRKYNYYYNDKYEDMLNYTGPITDLVQRSQKLKEPGSNVSHTVLIHCSIQCMLKTA